MEDKIMSITKTFLPDKGICKVVFTLPEVVGDHAKKVAIVGDFNSWNPDQNLMRADKHGHFNCTLELPVGKLYEFRYLIDDIHWVNEWDADAYAPTPYAEVYNMIISCVDTNEE